MKTYVVHIIELSSSWNQTGKFIHAFIHALHLYCVQSIIISPAGIEWGTRSWMPPLSSCSRRHNKRELHTGLESWQNWKVMEHRMFIVEGQGKYDSPKTGINYCYSNMNTKECFVFALLQACRLKRIIFYFMLKGTTSKSLRLKIWGSQNSHKKKSKQ